MTKKQTFAVLVLGAATMYAAAQFGPGGGMPSPIGQHLSSLIQGVTVQSAGITGSDPRPPKTGTGVTA